MAITANGDKGFVAQKSSGSSAMGPITMNAGDLAVMQVIVKGTSPSVNNITDTKGNTWTSQAITANGTAISVEIWTSLLTSTLTNGVDTITVTYNGTVTASAVEVSSYSGATATRDGNSGQSGSGSTTNTGSITTTNANDLLIGVVGETNSGTTWSDTSGGYTQLQNFASSGGSASTNVSLSPGYKIVTSTGANQRNVTAPASTTWAGSGAAFKAAAAGTPWSQTVNDSVTMSDSPSTVHGLGVVLADSVTMSDAQRFSRLMALGDSVTLADALRFARKLALTGDSVTMSDSSTQSVGHPVTITDSVALADALSMRRTLALADSATMSDSVTFKRLLALADSATMSDAIRFARTLALTDSATLADLASTHTGKGVTINDSTTLADALNFARRLALADSATMSDGLTPASGIHRTLADAATLADALAFHRGLALSESIVLVDAVTFKRLLALAETLGLADAANPVLTAGGGNHFTVNLSEALALADALGNNRGLGVVIADNLGGGNGGTGRARIVVVPKFGIY